MSAVPFDVGRGVLALPDGARILREITAPNGDILGRVWIKGEQLTRACRFNAHQRYRPTLVDVAEAADDWSREYLGKSAPILVGKTAWRMVAYRAKFETKPTRAFTDFEWCKPDPFWIDPTSERWFDSRTHDRHSTLRANHGLPVSMLRQFRENGEAARLGALVAAHNPKAVTK